jgi:hypothetical protein
MKLLGCTWSSQDVQHEALSLSLSLSLWSYRDSLKLSCRRQNFVITTTQIQATPTREHKLSSFLLAAARGAGGEIWLGTKIQGKLPDSLTSTKLRRRARHTEANKKDQSKKLKNNIVAASKKKPLGIDNNNNNNNTRRKQENPNISNWDFTNKEKQRKAKASQCLSFLGT